VKLNKQPDAAELARHASSELSQAIGHIKIAATYSAVAGAHPASKGVKAALIKIIGWRDKLDAAVRLAGDRDDR
jgi:hypothetical protein